MKHEFEVKVPDGKGGVKRVDKWVIFTEEAEDD